VDRRCRRLTWGLSPATAKRGGDAAFLCESNGGRQRQVGFRSDDLRIDDEEA
jgi:hypothetical protein